MKNIQIIDGADNCTFSLFQATPEEFAHIFPQGQDIEFIEDFLQRIGEEKCEAILDPIWKRPILKSRASGIHGTLFFEFEAKKHYFPLSKREMDFDSSSINKYQRQMYKEPNMTQHPTPKKGISEISPYAPGKSKVDGAARVIKLSSNENPWGPSPKAIAAYSEQATQMHRYPDGGHASLREAIARVQNLPAEQLICGAGSDELLGMLVHAYAGAGDEVLYTQHGFLMYKIYTLSNGATPVSAPEKNLHTDVDALLTAVTPRTKIVFVANPNNPTGTVIPFSEIRRLRAGLREDIILGLDAAYAEYLDQPDYEDGLSLVREGSNTIVFHTFSKIYGLPALRLGWAFAPAHIIDVMNRVRSPFNVNAPALAAGVAAMEDVAYVADMRAKNASELARVVGAITKLGYEIVPSVTNFILVKFGADVAKKMNAHLASRGLIVREVAGYGLPDYLRISIGTTEENGILIAALNDFAKVNAA